MAKVWMQVRNGGLFPADMEGEQLLMSINSREIECDVKALDIRSRAEHNLFFACIQAAFSSWPQSHYFTPLSPEHLRAWLLCEAGYCTSTLFQVVHGAPAGCSIESADGEVVEVARTIGELGVIVANAVRGAKEPIVDSVGPAIRVRIPKSIAWRNLGQKRFHQIIVRVEEVLAREIGVTIDDLKHAGEDA